MIGGEDKGIRDRLSLLGGVKMYFAGGVIEHTLTRSIRGGRTGGAPGGTANDLEGSVVDGHGLVFYEIKQINLVKSKVADRIS